MWQDGMTALHWAAYNGHIAAVELLLKRGANIEVLKNVRSLGVSERLLRVPIFA